MASNGNPGPIPVAATNGSQSGGNTLPSNGKSLPAAAALPVAAPASPSPTASASPSAAYGPAPRATVGPTSDPHSLVQNLNKFLNDSGRPDQFRLDPTSGGKLIQQINPSTGAVIGEFSATEFPALARSVGVPGLLLDSLA